MSASATYPRGSRWRMTFEGAIDDDGDFVVSNGFGPLAAVHPQAFAAARVERLHDPMPDWQSGDVVAVNDGFHDTILVRRGDGTWACNAVDCPNTDRHDDGYLSRDWDLGDVRVLVRDGKSVSS